MIFEAVDMALKDAQLEPGDIDAILIGNILYHIDIKY
jgi:3-oxoacyl-[acyl-carrier-protein] synthase III